MGMTESAIYHITAVLPPKECKAIRAHISALEEKVRALDALEKLIRAGFWVWRMETVPVEQELIRIAIQDGLRATHGYGATLPEAILKTCEAVKK